MCLYIYHETIKKALLSIFTKTWHYHGCVLSSSCRHFTEKSKHMCLKLLNREHITIKSCLNSLHSIQFQFLKQLKYTEVDCRTAAEMFKIVLFLALFSISLSVVSSVGSYCPYLNYPSYGYMATSRGYGYGSVATYSCNKGYYLHGNAKRRCFNTGVWGGIAPTCCKLINYVWLWFMYI